MAPVAPPAAASHVLWSWATLEGDVIRASSGCCGLVSHACLGLNRTLGWLAREWKAFFVGQAHQELRNESTEVGFPSCMDSVHGVAAVERIPNPVQALEPAQKKQQEI